MPFKFLVSEREMAVPKVDVGRHKCIIFANHPMFLASFKAHYYDTVQQRRISRV